MTRISAEWVGHPSPSSAVPTPAKTSDDAIVAAARLLLERNGTDGFSLSDVARVVGVKPPSLQKRIGDRAALLAALERRGFAELTSALRDAIVRPDGLRSTARAYRAFALRSPRLYARMLAPDAVRSAESHEWRQAAVAPVMQLLADEVGPVGALAAARALTAFLHGFVTMEATGAFRLGGDIDADFETALSLVLRGLRTTEVPVGTRSHEISAPAG